MFPQGVFPVTFPSSSSTMVLTCSLQSVLQMNYRAFPGPVWACLPKAALPVWAVTRQVRYSKWKVGCATWLNFDTKTVSSCPCLSNCFSCTNSWLNPCLSRFCGVNCFALVASEENSSWSWRLSRTASRNCDRTTRIHDLGFFTQAWGLWMEQNHQGVIYVASYTVGPSCFRLIDQGLNLQVRGPCGLQECRASRKSEHLS